jgi:hypothetical protein
VHVNFVGKEDDLLFDIISDLTYSWMNMILVLVALRVAIFLADGLCIDPNVLNSFT